MSVEAMKWASQQRTGSVSRKVVLLVLAWMARQEQENGPHIARSSATALAQRVDGSRATVERALFDLEKAGLIALVEAPARDRHGAFLPRAYRLSMQQGAAPSMQQGAAPSMQQGAAPSMQQGAAPSMQQGAAPSMQQGAAPSMQQGEHGPAADCSSAMLQRAALLDSGVDEEVDEGKTEQHAALTSAVGRAEERWRLVHRECGEKAPPVGKRGRELLGRFVAHGDALGDSVAAVVRRQRVLGDPVRHFRYLEQGALEDELQRAVELATLSAQFELQRAVLLGSVERLPAALAGRAQRELKAASSLPEVAAVRRAIESEMRAGGEAEVWQ